MTTIALTDLRTETPDARVERLYRVNRAFVWRCLARFGVPEARRDDAMQEVFLRVFSIDARHDPARGSERSWLFGVAWNVAREQRRWWRRREFFEPLPDDCHDHRGDAERDLQARDDLRAVERLLGALTPAHREVLVLCDYLELTAREAADILEVPGNTVGSRLRAARAAFSEALERHRRRTP